MLIRTFGDRARRWAAVLDDINSTKKLRAPYLVIVNTSIIITFGIDICKSILKYQTQNDKKR